MMSKPLWEMMANTTQLSLQCLLIILDMSRCQVTPCQEMLQVPMVNIGTLKYGMSLLKIGPRLSPLNSV